MTRESQDTKTRSQDVGSRVFYAAQWCFRAGSRLSGPDKIGCGTADSATNPKPGWAPSFGSQCVQGSAGSRISGWPPLPVCVCVCVCVCLCVCVCVSVCVCVTLRPLPHCSLPPRTACHRRSATTAVQPCLGRHVRRCLFSAPVRARPSPPAASCSFLPAVASASSVLGRSCTSSSEPPRFLTSPEPRRFAHRLPRTAATSVRSARVFAKSVCVCVCVCLCVSRSGSHSLPSPRRRPCRRCVVAVTVAVAPSPSVCGGNI